MRYKRGAYIFVPAKLVRQIYLLFYLLPYVIHSIHTKELP